MEELKLGIEERSIDLRQFTIKVNEALQMCAIDEDVLSELQADMFAKQLFEDLKAEYNS